MSLRPSLSPSFVFSTLLLGALAACGSSHHQSTSATPTIVSKLPNLNSSSKNPTVSASSNGQTTSLEKRENDDDLLAEVKATVSAIKFPTSVSLDSSRVQPSQEIVLFKKTRCKDQLKKLAKLPAGPTNLYDDNILGNACDDEAGSLNYAPNYFLSSESKLSLALGLSQQSSTAEIRFNGDGTISGYSVFEQDSVHSWSKEAAAIKNGVYVKSYQSNDINTYKATALNGDFEYTLNQSSRGYLVDSGNVASLVYRRFRGTSTLEVTDTTSKRSSLSTWSCRVTITDKNGQSQSAGYDDQHCL